MTRYHVMKRATAQDPPATSALATAAAALSSNGSVVFTPGLSHGLIEDDLAWQTLFYHDTVNGLAQLMGKRANADTSWTLRTYDVTNNVGWANNDPSSINRSGHIYGNYTMDPLTGRLYLLPGNSPSDRALYRFVPSGTSGTWSIVADPIFTAGLNMPANGLGWHPNLYGSGQGGTCTVAEVNGTSEGMSCFKASNSAVQQISVGEGNLGRFYGQGVYFAPIDRVVLGGSNHILVAGHATTPTWSAVGAPPIPTKGDSMEPAPTGNLGNFGTMMVHPGNANKMILLRRGGARDYYTSTDGNSWTASLGAHPFDTDAYALCSTAHDVIWCLGADESGAYSMLWKPPT